MSDSRREYVFINLSQKDTDELIAIWREHDETQWSELAFDVIQEILQDRQVELPPQDEPGTQSTKSRFRPEIDVLTDVEELERRIKDRETQLLQARNKKTAHLVTLIMGSASLAFCGCPRTLDLGLRGIVASAAVVALFAGFWAWRLSRAMQQEEQLQSELDEYRDKKADVEGASTVEE